MRGYRRAARVAELGVRAQVSAACGACHSCRRHPTKDRSSAIREIGFRQTKRLVTCWNAISAQTGKPARSPLRQLALQVVRRVLLHDHLAVDGDLAVWIRCSLSAVRGAADGEDRPLRVGERGFEYPWHARREVDRLSFHERVRVGVVGVLARRLRRQIEEVEIRGAARRERIAHLVACRLSARRAMTYRNSGGCHGQCHPDPGCRFSHVRHIAARYLIVTKTTASATPYPGERQTNARPANVNSFVTHRHSRNTRDLTSRFDTAKGVFTSALLPTLITRCALLTSTTAVAAGSVVAATSLLLSGCGTRRPNPTRQTPHRAWTPRGRTSRWVRSTRCRAPWRSPK